MSRQVLVVDDDPTIRDHVSWCLRTRGFDVRTACNGAEALPLLADTMPDILITDVSMPRMNGFELVERMRGMPAQPQPRVIYLSSCDDKAGLKRAMRLGAGDYLTKPVSTPELLAAVTAQVEQVKDSPQNAGIDTSLARAAADAGYEVDALLGQGSAATVYRAHRKAHPGSTAALKVLKLANENLGGEAITLSRFFNEYALLSGMSHRGVARVYEHGVTDDQLFIAMEYFSGGDLARIIGRSLPPGRALDIVEQVATALSYIHAAGIVHRDLKPSNIMLREDGSVAIVDFGIAKNLSVALEHTAQHQTVGTPFYMSPESIRATNVCPQSDLYALGLILFEMLTGNRPYAADSIESLLHQHLNAPVPALPARYNALQPLLNRLMAKDVDARYQSADEVLEAIRALASSAQG